jgi:dolichol kinase
MYADRAGIVRNSALRPAAQVEMFRKAIHLAIAVVPGIAAIDVLAAAGLLAVGIAIYAAAEQARIAGIRVALISDITVLALRERDRQGFVLGPVTLGLGAMLALLFYPEPAATVAIYALAFGDSAAAVVGTAVGRLKIRGTGGKSLAGSLACFLAVLAVTLRVTGNLNASLAIAGAAALLEAAPTRDYDNLLVPVGVGLVALLLL